MYPADRYNIPDWKDSAFYLRYETLERFDRRWEFIRRSKLYRELWHLATAWPPSSRTVTENELCKKFKLNAMLDPTYSAMGAARQGVIVGWVDPFALMADQADSQVLPVLESAAEGFPQLVDLAKETERALAVIDLSQPLEPQFEEIRRQAKELREIYELNPDNRGRQLAKIPMYLNVLDAHDFYDQSFYEIAVELSTKRYSATFLASGAYSTRAAQDIYDAAVTMQNRCIDGLIL